MTFTVRGDLLVYRQDEQELALTVGTAAWFAWLETASTFSFVSEAGTFTARREQAGHKRGGWYWKAYRKQQGKLSSTYLGKSEGLTLDRLNAAAQTLAQMAVRDAQANADEEAPPQHQPASTGIPSPPCWRPNSMCRACEHSWSAALTSSSDSSGEQNARSPSSRPPPASAKRRCLPSG